VGLFQVLIAPRLGLFPWHCDACRKLFLVKERGKSKNKEHTKFADHMLNPWKAGVDVAQTTAHNPVESYEDENRNPS
jgi:hypothetical protein